MAKCNFPTCNGHAEKNGYCVRHRIYAPGGGSKPKDDGAKKGDEKKKPIRPRRKSKKLESREREYRKLVGQILAENPYCEMATPECTGIAQGLHHMKGRGVHLLNKKFLKRACNACNGYVERHPAYAMEHGLSVSRHAKG